MTGALRTPRPSQLWPLALAVLVGCPDPLANEKVSAPSGAAARADTRYMKIRALLEEDPDAPARAKKLYPLVAPLCRSEKEREELVATAKWSVSFSEDDYYLPSLLAGDTIEHVATACARTSTTGAFDLLEKARAAMPELKQLAVVEARLRAASGDLAAAEAAARAAMKAGSVHAIALTANIQARRARAASVEYRKGMLDAAIETVSVEPSAEWMPIDLTAVLSTKARLLSERALWEPEAAAKQTRLEAAGLHQRLSKAPFIEAVRRRALDWLCFEAAEAGRDLYDACPRFAELGELGAAKAIGKEDLPAARFDLARLSRVRALREDALELEAGTAVVLVVRGDELELLEWIRPVSGLLAWLDRRSPKWIVVDRTSEPRASKLVDRLLDLGGVQPSLRIRAEGTFTMPCVAALLAKRRTPKGCPLDPSTQKTLRAAKPYGFSLLVGRDLDAEIDDLRLYELRTVLLSFRQSRMEKGIDVWLPSLSDVPLLTEPEGFGALD